MQLSPFTHNSKLFTLISKDVTKLTVHTSQFRVPQFSQKAGCCYTKNGWKQYKRERRKSMCVRGGEQAVRGWGQEQQGVENIVSADSALGIFPFPQGDDSVWDVEKHLQPDQHEDMILKQNQSLSLTLILQLHNSSECTLCKQAFHWEFFTVCKYAQYASVCKNIQTFDRPIQYSVQ